MSFNRQIGNEEVVHGPVEFYLVAAKNETMKISKKLHLTLNKEDAFLQQK